MEPVNNFSTHLASTQNLPSYRGLPALTRNLKAQAPWLHELLL